MNRDPWVENLFHPLVIATMVGCVALSLVELVRLIDPAWNGAYLIIGCVLAALEASYSYRLVRARPLRGTRLVRFRVIELLMYLVLLKFGGYVGEGWPDVLADMRTWPSRPLNILDLETMIAFCLALSSWWASTRTIRDLERIGEPSEYRRGQPRPRESLTKRFFWGGGVLLVAAGLTRVGIAALLKMSHPSVPGLVLNVLVYFLLGLVMLGQVQFATLRKRWRARKIKIADELPGHWARYSLIFIGLAAVMAFLLPTGYTMGLLDTVGVVLGYISAVLHLIVRFILLLLSLPLWLLLLLLSLLTDAPSPHAPAPRRLEPIPSRPAPGGVAPSWFETLRSLVFWAVALGAVIYVIRSYLRDHPGLLKELTALRPIQALRALAHAIWDGLLGLSQAVDERLPRPSSSSQPSPTWSRERFRFLRIGARSLRERILHYYLSVLRRARRSGFPRHGDETPYEYETTLRSQLTQVEDEVARLTQAFVEARYSLHAVDRAWEERVRADWKRLKAALRALRRASDVDELSEPEPKT